ncbi:class I SAM-dependent methyltransferase [Ruegeria profundi]|uniref:class I SAM-dependent methyltransferase n=1 Tax=Ruegeria profundi TaxID=1685378 RepID=UPI003C79F621
MAEDDPYFQTVKAGYEHAAQQLIPAYDSLSPTDVLRPVLDHLPDTGASVLDVGAGTGRVARWLAKRSCDVTAIEPVDAFRNYAMRGNGAQSIKWLDACLPRLSALPDGVAFDTILVMGVLHHLPPRDQHMAIRVLAKRLRPQGRMILSLRHGPCPPDRPGHVISDNAIIDQAVSSGLQVHHRSRTDSIQPANQRAGVIWTWLVFGAAYSVSV